MCICNLEFLRGSGLALCYGSYSCALLFALQNYVNFCFANVSFANITDDDLASKMF